MFIINMSKVYRKRENEGSLKHMYSMVVVLSVVLKVQQLAD